MVKLVVTSSVPGRPRAGVNFTGAMVFEHDRFSKAQLKAIAADPVLTLVAGNVITAEDVDDYVAQVEAYKAVREHLDEAEKNAAEALNAPDPDTPAPEPPPVEKKAAKGKAAK